MATKCSIIYAYTKCSQTLLKTSRQRMLEDVRRAAKAGRSSVHPCSHCQSLHSIPITQCSSYLPEAHLALSAAPLQHKSSRTWSRRCSQLQNSEKEYVEYTRCQYLLLQLCVMVTRLSAVTYATRRRVSLFAFIYFNSITQLTGMRLQVTPTRYLYFVIHYTKYKITYKVNV